MKAKNVCIVHEGHWVTLTPAKRRKPARPAKMVRLFFRWRSLSENRVRFRFINANTGRVCLPLIFPHWLMTAAERATQKTSTCLGQFIIAGLESDPATLTALEVERKAMA